MARNRMKGKGITFTFKGQEYKCDLVSAVLQKESAGGDSSTDSTITFCDAETGAASGQAWKLSITAVQSTDNGATDADKSLHTLIWEAAAGSVDTEIPFVFAPHGNATPSQTQPHYTGTAIVKTGAYPAVGGSAGESSWTWDYTFDVKDNTIVRKETTR